jgi:2-polyprenyl-3-methyl-5-hydroxy-6-metoxy-1,4-benzoquinol methylase
MLSDRNLREIEHGKILAQNGAENIWGWESPAGKVRAQRRANLILSRLINTVSSNVLEIGCGTGNFTILFAPFIGQLTAIDISEDLLKIAQKNKASFPNVNFVHSSFEMLSKHTQYDSVIGSSVLHHLEIRPTLRQIYHLLKPGGMISFAEPNMLNPQIILQKNIPWIKKKLGDSPDETAFFRWQLTKILRESGYINPQVTPFDLLHPMIPNYLIDTVSSVGLILEKIPLINEFAGSLLISAKKGSY